MTCLLVSTAVEITALSPPRARHRNDCETTVVRALYSLPVAGPMPTARNRLASGAFRRCNASEECLASLAVKPSQPPGAWRQR